jgi:hypothetical protein
MFLFNPTIIVVFLDSINNWQAKPNTESLYDDLSEFSHRKILFGSSPEGPVLPAMSFPARITTAAGFRSITSALNRRAFAERFVH